MWTHYFECNKCGFEIKIDDNYVLKNFGYCPSCGKKITDAILSDKQKQVLYMGCEDCKYCDKEENEEPCKSCSHNHVDKFEFIEK